ncbi:MAG TPA: ATP-binding protein [Gaiellaceae bacterium]|nr:ATP-binding protein [Gaiellaceae bacterium]
MPRLLAVRPALVWLATALGYYALARLSSQVELVHEGVPLILFAQGVAYSSVLLGGPWLATAVAVGAAGEAFSQGLPIASVALFAASAAAAGLTALAVTRSAGLRPDAERLTDTLIRTGAAIAAGIVAGSLVLAANAVDGRMHAAAKEWMLLVLANVAGIIVVAPFVRAWAQRVARGVAPLPEWIALVAVSIGTSLLVDTGVLGKIGPTAYIMVSVVIWGALRCGRMGMSVVVVVSAVIGAECTVDGRGPFVVSSLRDSAVSLDTFLIVLGLSGLLVVGIEEARHQAQAGHLEAAERHRRLIEQLPLVTYMRSLVDPAAPPIFQSSQTEALLGYPLERWMTEPRFAKGLIHPDDRQINAELNARSLTEDLVQGEYRMIRADGRTVWVLDHMAVVRNAAGEPVAQQGFVVDISERKALEEQLGQAQRLEALGLLAGGIAHDFNNLLTAISGYSGLALDHGGRDNELMRRDLGEVRTATARAAALTRQLLAFGRRQVLERTVVDLNDVVIEAQSLLGRVIGEKVTVATRLDPDLVRVYADVGQLGQVLVNLALNARDAMPRGGTLSIVTSNENDDAVITVSDTGHGMDEQTRARIFEPFFSTKPVGEGTGLGLAMVHGIVQQTGGEISVESAPGGGTAFRIAFPGTLDVPVVENVAPIRASPRGSETVLLVEDEDIVRRLVAMMLEGQGYSVLLADGPREALEVSEPFDLLLTDIVMPSMSGPELAERVIEHHRGVGVLFTSGYSGSAVADRGALIADLLEKPFTIEELAQKVREALDARVIALT